MNNLPRRSARLSQLHQHQSSAASSSPSSTPSSTSTSSQPSPLDNFVPQRDQLGLLGLQLQSQVQPQFLQTPQQFYAPQPSPSTNEVNPFFHFAQSNSLQMPQHSQQAAQQSQQQKTQNQQASEHHNSFSSQQQHRPNMQAGNKQGQLPPDFLAEAARRAQIACLMRDMGDVTL